MEKNKFIPIAEPVFYGNEEKYVSDCIRTKWVSSAGSYVQRFEEVNSKYCGMKFGIATSNGTSALHLALSALDIKPNDEVIIPALTFVATASVVRYVGAKPVFVDVERNTWCMNPEEVRKKISKKTRAIIPVHLYGHPCDMDPLLEIASKNNIAVVEDVAEAHGAEYKGKKAGSFGIISCFSFFGNKIVTTGEGGMCLTNNKKLAEKMRLLRDHGMDKNKRYWHPVIGFNYRMTNMQAALGLAQLENIEKTISKKIENAHLYNKLLKDCDYIELPPKQKWAKNVYWMYSLLLKNKKEELMDKLKKEGIDTRPVFYPLNKMPPYATSEDFPVTEKISRAGLSLPSSAMLTEKDITRITEVIKDGY